MHARTVGEEPKRQLEDNLAGFESVKTTAAEWWPRPG